MTVRADIITRALRLLKVASVNNPPTADEAQQAGVILDSVFAMLGTGYGRMDITWDLTDVPDEFVVPLSRLLAVHCADDFARKAPDTEQTALVRMSAAYYRYPGVDMDLNNDGTVSDEEVRAYDEGTYF